MPRTAIKNALPGEHARDRTPDKIQRLLHQVAWDTFAVRGVAQRFAVAGPDQAARWGGQVAATIDVRPGQAGGARCLGQRPPSRLCDARTEADQHRTTVAALHHADNVPAPLRHGRAQAKKTQTRPPARTK